LGGRGPKSWTGFCVNTLLLLLLIFGLTGNGLL